MRCRHPPHDRAPTTTAFAAHSRTETATPSDISRGALHKPVCALSSGVPPAPPHQQATCAPFAFLQASMPSPDEEKLRNAARDGDASTVQRLLAAKVNVNCRNVRRCTAAACGTARAAIGTFKHATPLFHCARAAHTAGSRGLGGGTRSAARGRALVAIGRGGASVRAWRVCGVHVRRRRAWRWWRLTCVCFHTPSARPRGRRGSAPRRCTGRHSKATRR